MTSASLCVVTQSLNDVNVRYLVIGGVAVVAHGYVRCTIDLDLLLDLNPANIFRATDALRRMGYVSKIKTTMDELADPVTRCRMVDDGIQLLRLRSPLHDWMGIELLTHDPLGFDGAYARRMNYELTPGIVVPVCAYEDVVSLKRQANRPSDIADLVQLEKARSMPTEAELNDPWFSATFEGCELVNLHQAAAWPFADKVAQLEEMHALARAFQETRHKMGGVRTIRAGGLIEDV